MSKADIAQRAEDQKNKAELTPIKTDGSPERPPPPSKPESPKKKPTPRKSPEKSITPKKPPASSFANKPSCPDDKDPFFFYMQIRTSELNQEKQLQNSNHPEATDQKLPSTHKEIYEHVQGEWKMLTEEQKNRFNIPPLMQMKLRERKSMEDVEVLRSLVLT